MLVLTIDEREALLAAEIPRYLQDGWTVVAVTRVSATLSKPRSIDPGGAILSLLLCGIGLLIYLAVHASRGPETIYLLIDEQGQKVVHAGPR